MDADALITGEIDRLVGALLPHGAGPITEHRLRWALDQIAQRARTIGRDEALLSLRTVEDAAAAWNVSERRARAHIAHLHDRWSVGMQVGKTWLVTQDEIDRHAPGPAGRPRKELQE